MDIFVINTSEIKNFSEEFLKNFQKKEISNQKTLMIHCLTYAMLDRILKETYKIKDRTIIFEDSKPALKSKEKFFSLSHSSKKIAIAFSDYNCGIDIEKTKPREYKTIAKRMKFNCNNLKEFYQEWTKYEASYKLNDKASNLYYHQIDDYALTAVSINPEEKFELFIS